MKITVDTKQDSKEHIQQVILLLSKLIEAELDYYEKEKKGTLKQENQKETTAAFTNMFGAEEPMTEEKEDEKKEETETKKKESNYDDEDEVPKIELY